MAIIGLAAFLFFEYEMSSDIAGGFKEGTEEYKGYQYARDNNLKRAEQCDEKADSQADISEKFIDGCKKYFVKN